jgi:cyclophilin family peptidyl-prolyl cis-trans isomerase
MCAASSRWRALTSRIARRRTSSFSSAWPHLDSKFAAFGTVTKGMEVVDAINQAPVEGDKPEKPGKDQSRGC